MLLNAIVKGLVGMRDFVKRSLRKEEKEVDLRRSRAVLNIRRKICEPVLHAWRDLMRSHQRLLKRSARHCFHSSLSKGWRTWRELVAENRAAALEQRKQGRKLARIQTAARRIANAKLAAGWNSWVAMWEERCKFARVRPRFRRRLREAPLPPTPPRAAVAARHRQLPSARSSVLLPASTPKRTADA